MEKTKERKPAPRRAVATDAWQADGAKKAPVVDLKTYRLRIFGKVDREVSLSLEQLAAMPAVTKKLDMSCATRLSRPEDEWTGIPMNMLLAMAAPRGDFLMLWSRCSNYSASVPLEKVDDDCMVAFAWNGEPLGPKHGGPVRAIMPGHYAWKNTLWLDGIEVMDKDRPGSWETGGSAPRVGLRKGEGVTEGGRALAEKPLPKRRGVR